METKIKKVKLASENRKLNFQGNFRITKGMNLVNVEKRTSNNKLRKEYVYNLMCRCIGKPINKTYHSIELSRRIVQLLLLCYKRPLKSPSIRSILRSCFNYRSEINNLRLSLEEINLNQDKFILFCFWSLNKYPMKLNLALLWVIKEALITLRKYETAQNDLWDIVFKFSNSSERGIKLSRIVKIKENLKKDDVYFKIKKL